MKHLKEAIVTDVALLKQIDIDIMDTKSYYKEVKRWGVTWFLTLFLTTLLVGAICMTYTGKELYAGYLMHELELYFGISFIASLLLTLGPISYCGAIIVFKEQVFPRLLTKDLITKQIIKSAKQAYVVFIICLFLGTTWIGWPFIGVVVPFAFAITMGVVRIFVTIEISRIGATALLAVLKGHFSKVIDVNKIDDY